MFLSFIHIFAFIICRLCALKRTVLKSNIFNLRLHHEVQYQTYCLEFSNYYNKRYTYLFLKYSNYNSICSIVSCNIVRANGI